MVMANRRAEVSLFESWIRNGRTRTIAVPSPLTRAVVILYSCHSVPFSLPECVNIMSVVVAGNKDLSGAPTAFPTRSETTTF